MTISLSEEMALHSGVRELALALLRGACSTVLVEKLLARSLGLGASSGR